MAGARRRPVPRDHGQHLVISGQDIHCHRGHAAGLGPGDHRAHQGRADASALPGIGHHHADIRHRIAPGGGPVRGHGVPDDNAARDGDHGVEGAGAAGEVAEQGGAWRDRGEESQVAAPRGQPREEVAECGLVRREDRPDGHGWPVCGYDLSSVHGPSITGFAESVN